MASALPEVDLTYVAQWCAGHVPDHLLDQVRVEYKVRGRNITIFECRAPWQQDPDADWFRRPAAQLRYGEDGWRLYWPDRNARWYLLDDVPATRAIAPLLTYVDDPDRAFWS